MWFVVIEVMVVVIYCKIVFVIVVIISFRVTYSLWWNIWMAVTSCSTYKSLTSSSFLEQGRWPHSTRNKLLLLSMYVVTFSHCRFYSAQILCGLQFLHSRGVIYRWVYILSGTKQGLELNENGFNGSEACMPTMQSIALAPWRSMKFKSAVNTYLC